ncbi:HpcH/HpaI aldolase family protein [Hominifimenecus sp. rT4P-3]|uniref:HpcH/HpaI aldolase family protein n=1 Tax=Hominifimenecus sp. rT4P-3 TaxID=3242979 RepID=UPI003DA62A97
MKTLKEKIQGHELVVGTWINNLHSAAMVQTVAASGFDFVAFDMQHGAVDSRELATEFLIARLNGLTPLVRSYQPYDFRLNAKLLDLGAQGLIVPDVDSAELVENTVQSMRYFRGGTRGIVNRSYRSGFQANKKDDFENYDRDNVLVIQIESQKAVERIDEILAVEGIDVVIIGRGDLAHDLGVTGEMDHPKVAECVDQVYQAAERCHVTAGLMCPTAEKAKERIKAGARFINYSNEQAILMKAYGSFVEEVRKVSV